MTDSSLSTPTALVTGASRGFGRAIAAALHADGAQVVAVARSADSLHALRDELGDRLIPVVADVADPVVAGTLMDQYRPDTLVLNAGAAPLPRRLQDQTWETFSRNWEVDVRQAFHWIREALLLPLRPGSTVVAMSSGAALAGSPLSGGYAGAKATIRLIAGYAADESARAGLGIRFVSVLPKLTATTELGSQAVAAYARRNDMTVEQYLEEVGPGLTPDDVGKAAVELMSATEPASGAFLLTPAGLSPLQ
ncbi:MAG TPA: SDR family oxidoreductase [Acidimicrobiales bacterium]|jgi:NAD(P)-dependent dehydrogenase (short-subunit alcohol dehydrogenase family)